ncbi:MAG: hypothetical protein LBH20_06085 [Treponema sp.]|jgi:hypothetical protein|nr:hypothetical protein [Treponema sp.]
MDYKKFYLAIRRYVKGKTTRGDFLLDWEHAQRQQGTESASGQSRRNKGTVTA